MIEVDEVHKAFGRAPALAGVSFAVARGEVVGFVGPNGAGKTTALRIIAGFIAADRGRVSVDGYSVERDREQVGARLAYLPESVPLYQEMRVDSYLRFRGRIKGVARVQLDEAVDRAVKLAQLEDRRTEIIGALSRGYRQRVGIADAVVARPLALLLDEPLAGLDPVQVRQFHEVLGQLDSDCAVLMSSHDLSQVESLCDRVVVLVGGKVVANGTPAEIRGDRSLEDVFIDLARGSDGR